MKKKKKKTKNKKKIMNVDKIKSQVTEPKYARPKMKNVCFSCVAWPDETGTKQIIENYKE